MSKLLLGQLGLTNYLRTDTVSSHPWHRPDEWQLKPSEGWVNPPTGYNSVWGLKPKAGEMFVVTACQVQMSADAIITNANAMQVHVTIQNPIPPIYITQFAHLDEFLNRASEVFYYPISGVGENAEITRPFYRAIIPFAQQILLWSTAGLNLSTTQPYRDRSGNVKFRSMTAKIANNLPYLDATGSITQTAWSRYFIDVYQDPDYKG
jgi:hypothetical protein